MTVHQATRDQRRFGSNLDLAIFWGQIPDPIPVAPVIYSRRFAALVLEKRQERGLGLDRHHAVLVEPHAAEDEAGGNQHVEALAVCLAKPLRSCVSASHRAT